MARLSLLAIALLIVGAVSANAQGAPPTPPSASGPEAAAQPAMGGHGGYMGMHHPPMGMMQKSAGFRFKRDGAEIDIRCASNEPTRACVDAASILIDKLASMKTTP
jgi:hypothetical protein